MNLSTLNPNELVGPSGRNVQSAYFDGTGDNLSIASANGLCNFAANEAYTFQVWAYRLSTAEMVFLGSAGSFQVGVINAGVRFSRQYIGDIFFNVGSVPVGAWTHITICRDTSGTTRCWTNGVSAASITDTGSFALGTTNIGSQPGGTTPTNGYLCDMRLLKGQALYDPTSAANIPVPTAPLTPIANTSFLLGFSEYRFIDQSPNNFTITRNGDTTQSTLGPYGNNWSNVFDGTGDYLTVPDNTSLNMGTGDFTVEAWVNRISAVSGSSSADTIVAKGSNNLIIGVFFTSGFFVVSRYGAAALLTSTTAVVNGTWYHVAVTRSGSTMRLFVNGAQEATTTSSADFSSTTELNIGRDPNFTTQRWYGYISGLRIVKGTAVYTSNFTPPTAPLSSIPNTSLLTCQSNRFLDSSPNNFAITRNGDVSVQPYVPFPANWSNYFDGNGDYLSVASSSALDLTSGNFTIELWVYPRSYSASNRTLLSKDGRFGVSYSQYSLAFSSTGILTGTVGTGNSTGYIQAISSPTALALNAWYHVAFVKNGTTLTLYVNGVSVASATQTGTMTTGSQALIIGWEQGQPLTHYTDGYLSNLRIVKGTALYTSNFTPSTTPLTAIPNTSLLTCQSSSFTDFSSNNFTITANGDVSARFYGPFLGPVPEPVVDIYTNTASVNTWIKRPGAKAVQMIAIGAGGGGGGGMGSASSVQRNGGAGGGGGANGQIIYTADQLPSTLYIRVGASGTGGASNTSGGAGGNSTIAAADPITSSTSVYCMGGGGGGGEAGAASSSSVGGGGGGTAGAGTTGTGDNAVSGGFPALGAGFALGGGGAGGGNGAAGTTSYAAEWGGGGGGGVRNDGANRQPGGGSLYGGGGGGVGGFVNSAGGAADGICGGASGRYTFGTDQSNFGGGAAGAGSAGGAGANASTLYAAGSGGGGGGVSGFAGGAGGFPGGGGGGGGASTTTGGTGGVGGAGRVVLITFF